MTTPEKPARDSAGLTDYLFALPQYLLPTHALSAAMHRIARSRWRGFKDPFTRWFVGRYQVNLAEAQQPDPAAYESFNAFFTRALRPEARPMHDEAGTAICPVDGAVSQAGHIAGDTIFQAKGRSFDLDTLVGGAEYAKGFRNGRFATLYLSPRDYHRIHMPLAGKLTRMTYIPGRLFSVNAATAKVIPSLFARNERVVCHFDTEYGPMAMILVGAVFVGSIETVWAGEVAPPRHWYTETKRYLNDAPQLGRGEEMGRFNMG
ncbi:MAG: phosphatidylserine decarboxylase, partial [Chromatiales bacterium]|nr:phosphatidylserine decarboxylase [Chromatiales bacterium]